MPNVTVVGASGAIVTVPFTGSANYTLAQQLAAIINNAAPLITSAGLSNPGGNPIFPNGTAGNLDATNAPTQPTTGGLTEEVVTLAGAYSTAPGTNFLTANVGATITGSPFLNVLASGPLTFTSATSGNDSIAAGSGGNSISMAPGTSYGLALGGGGNTVFASGSGTVDASQGGPGNLLEVGQQAGTQNLVFSAGTGDTIAAGAGVATIGETGSNASIYLGSGQDVVADGGTNDTIVGSTSPGDQTVFGGNGTFIYGMNSTIYDAAGVGASTVVGGVKDSLFGGPGSDINYFSGSTGASLVAGAGNETLNAGPSKQNDLVIGGSGNASIALGSGADTLAFFNGKAGGTDVVTGFTSVDTLSTVGYGSAAPTVTTASGSTTVMLSDGTKITLSGFANSGFIKGT